FYDIVRGVDNRPVEADRETKSISVEDTFAEDVLDIEILEKELERLAQLLFTRLEKYRLYGRTVTLKIKYHDFKIISRSKTFPDKVSDPALIAETVKQLLKQTEAGQKKIRLLGVDVSGFVSKDSE